MECQSRLFLEFSRCERFLERVSKIDSASHQVLTCEIGYGLSFCHEEAAEAVDR
jgi:hypothetical protein